MFYPIKDQDIANIYRLYTDLALQEYRLGNIRQANVLYRRGKKYLPDPKIVPKTIGTIANNLEVEPIVATSVK